MLAVKHWLNDQLIKKKGKINPAHLSQSPYGGTWIVSVNMPLLLETKLMVVREPWLEGLVAVQVSLMLI